MESIQQKASNAIKEHPYPDMIYSGSSLKCIKEEAWIAGYEQALEDIKNPFPSGDKN